MALFLSPLFDWKIRGRYSCLVFRQSASGLISLFRFQALITTCVLLDGRLSVTPTPIGWISKPGHSCLQRWRNYREATNLSIKVLGSWTNWHFASLEESIRNAVFGDQSNHHLHCFVGRNGNALGQLLAVTHNSSGEFETLCTKILGLHAPKNWHNLNSNFHERNPK